MKKQKIKWLLILLAMPTLVGSMVGCNHTSNVSSDSSTTDITTGAATDANDLISTTTSSTAAVEMTDNNTSTMTIIKISATDTTTSVASTATSSEVGASPITSDNIHYFAYCNANLISKKPCGIVLDFHGLGETGMFYTPSELGQICASKGILYIQPYDNPWSWMNDLAVRYTDEIVDAVIDKYDLPENVPIVTAGGSMGGLSCLIYTRYAKRTPVACAANCPVTDLPYHYTERPDLPRTIYQAFMHYPGDLNRAIESASPYHQAANFPKDTTYLIVAGDADTAVNKTMHSDRFVPALKKTCDKVTYVEVPGMGHCTLPDEEKKNYFAFITSDQWFS